MRISDWSSDVCSSDLAVIIVRDEPEPGAAVRDRDGRPLEIIGERLWHAPDLHRPDGAVRADIVGVEQRGDRRKDRGDTQLAVNTQDEAIGQHGRLAEVPLALAIPAKTPRLPADQKGVV